MSSWIWRACLLLIVVAAGPAGAAENPAAPDQPPRQAAADSPPRVPFRVQQASLPELSTSQPISVSEVVARPLAEAPTSDAVREAPRLPPRQSPAERLAPPSSASSTRAVAAVAGSLIAVLALFFVVVWVSRKTAPQGLAQLPGEVVESLGRTPLAGRQQAQLLRVGHKLVLISITPNGIEPITEITDPAEVDRLSALCQASRAGSITETFRHVLSQFGSEPAPRGFVGE